MGPCNCHSDSNIHTVNHLTFCSEFFLGDQPCKCGVPVKHFWDFFLYYHVMAWLPVIFEPTSGSQSHMSLSMCEPLWTVGGVKWSVRINDSHQPRMSRLNDRLCDGWDDWTPDYSLFLLTHLQTSTRALKTSCGYKIGIHGLELHIYI
jgi:hypothetical protein